MMFKPKRWTYDKPSNSDLDKVRFLVGDTNADDKQLDDCEIEWLLEENGNPIGAAICAALALAAMYSRQYSSNMIGSIGDLAQHYRDLAADLNKKRSRRAVSAYAGGISVADKESRNLDTSLVRPEFSRDMMKQYFVQAGISPPWRC